MADNKICKNCTYFRSKNGIASFFDDYYCSNPENVHEEGFFNKTRVYRTVKSTSSCNFFKAKEDSGFRY